MARYKETAPRVPCPRCARPMPKKVSPTAICARCANCETDPAEWPSHIDATPQTVICPHCVTTRHLSCCVCASSRRVVLADDLLHSVWARPDCRCETCRVVGPMPDGDEDVTQRANPRQRIARGSTSTAKLPLAKGRLAERSPQTHQERKATGDGSAHRQGRERDRRLEDRDRIVETVQRADSVDAACTELGLTRDQLVAKLNGCGIQLRELRA